MTPDRAWVPPLLMLWLLSGKGQMLGIAGGGVVGPPLVPSGTMSMLAQARDQLFGSLSPSAVVQVVPLSEFASYLLFW